MRACQSAANSHCRTRAGELPALDLESFWSIIEPHARLQRPTSPSPRPWSTRLANHTQCDIPGYEERFGEVHGAVYRWDLWAAPCGNART
ncbi:DUF4240 domain-containing protein [Streptomyces sp. NBC_00572]|uniref:DUF4240 domain-containing protein n=1 Tax=Streptomyces sp. NBC_00572 TaxID=2903664 RepID=UPI00338F2B31